MAVYNNVKLPHKQLDQAISDGNKVDSYYSEVISWMNSDINTRTKLPLNSGHLTRDNEKIDNGNTTHNRFHVDKSGTLYYKDKIYVPESVRLTIMTACQDSLLAGHPGVQKTLELVRRDYWWPKQSALIAQYVKECDVCQRTKASRQKYTGLLHPLPTATKYWSSVTLDFITDLPLCEKQDTILVVVDRHTKMAHFTPCTKDITSRDTATLYIDRVFRYHGIPDEIISDRDVCFVSEFWKSFWERLCVQHKMSTGFHPQTDGQTEHVNQSLNQYLHIFSSYLQDDWVSLLLTAEFAYNNSVHTLTGYTPFYAYSAFNPKGIKGTATGASDKPNELAQHFSEVTPFLIENIEKAAEDMKRFADTNRQPAPKYKAGNKVLISSKNIASLRPKPKWSDKWIGPYEIIKEAYENSDTYVLKLPLSVKMHPVFHTSLLIPYRVSTIPDCVQPPPPPVIVDSEHEDEIESILLC